MRATHVPQRQALATRRDVHALDRRRHARSERQFRKVIGYSELAKLANAVERALAAQQVQTPGAPAREEATTLTHA